MLSSLAITPQGEDDGFLRMLEVFQMSVPADLVVTFERGPCFGACPVYTLTVFADWSVAYNGVAFVLAEGDQRAVLTSEEVEQLHQAIVDADFRCRTGTR
jgi:hypothetical protein